MPEPGAAIELQEWDEKANEYRSLAYVDEEIFGSDNRQHGVNDCRFVAKARLSLPQALGIIEAIISECGLRTLGNGKLTCADMVQIAESIINRDEIRSGANAQETSNSNAG